MTSKKLLHISVTAVLVLSVLAIFTACASSEDYTFVTEWGQTNLYYLTAMTVDSSGNVYVANNCQILKLLEPKLFIERNRIFSLDLEQK